MGRCMLRRRAARERPRAGPGGVAVLPALVFCWCCEGCLASSAAAPGSHQEAPGDVYDYVDVWLTTTDEQRKFEPQLPVPLLGAPAAPTVVINSTERYQRMIGFGAAMTDASAWVLHSKPPELYRLLMELLFGVDGLRISMLRVTIGVSDFSVSYSAGNRTYDDVDDDYTLQNFSTDHDDAYILPVLRYAKLLNPELKIVASPWTAPLWLKTSGDAGVLGSGTLLNSDAAYNTYAEFFALFVESYRDKGVVVDYLTLQNEPGHGHCQTMPCMKLNVEQEARLTMLVSAALKAKGLTSTRILGYDHNWGDPEFPHLLLQNSSVNRDLAGIAWHCYAGHVAEQAMLHARFPDKEVHMTECSGGDWDGLWASTLMRHMSNLMIGGPIYYGQSVLFWNMALDEHKGPHCIGGACCKNCRGVLMVPSTATSVTEVERSVEFFSLAHLSTVVPPGSQRIDATLRTAPSGFLQADAVHSAFMRTHDSYYSVDSAQVVAFETPDHLRTVLVAMNPTAVNLTLAVAVDGDRGFHYDLPPGVASFIWGKPRPPPPDLSEAVV